MERVSLDELAAAPVGRYAATERCVAWCATAELVGAAAWGDPTPDDVDFLAAAWDATVPGRPPFDKVFDVRGVARIAEDTFARLVQRARERAPVQRQVRRQLLLAPSGIASAVTAGFWNLVPSRHPWHVTTDPIEGFAWLGYPADTAASIEAVVTMLRDGTPLARLRRWLDDHLVDADLAAAARAIAISPRSLQRELADAGTSFRAELRARRLAAARRLLREPDAKVEAVAAAVGFDAASSFVRAFREEVGETPAAWRARAHAADRDG